MFPQLETERLILREISKSDAESIFSCFANEFVIRYYGLEKLEDIGQAVAIVDSFAKSFEQKKGIRWGIEIKGTPSIIGTIGFNNWSRAHKRAEIGYEIHPDYWRNGYTSEAVSEIIRYGFDELDLTRIGAFVFIENEASNQLLTKVGFQREGILRDYMYQNTEPNDTYVYSMLRKEYQAQSL